MVKRRANSSPPHLCHHPRCSTPVPEAMFACRDHWLQLPSFMRYDLLGEYVPGQEITKTPSAEYLDAANACIDWWDQRDLP